MEYKYFDSNYDTTYIERDHERHLRFNAHYVCGSCGEYWREQDIHHIIMEGEDDSWNDDEIICEECYYEQREDEAKGVITRLVKYVKKYLKNKQRVMEEQRERMKKCVKVMNGTYFKEWLKMKKEMKKMKKEIKELKHENAEWMFDWEGEMGHNCDLKREVEELKEQIEEQKVEMKWKIWGTTMLEHDYDIVNDYNAWDCVVMEHEFSKEEIKELSKYYPCPEKYE